MTSSIEATHSFAIEELLQPDVFPHPVRDITLRETHISYVILTGEFAYKIKKPVRLEFIDTTVLSRRLELCETELRLNQRLAPELYVDVVKLVRNREGRLRFCADGDALEYAVRMRQFDPGHELHQLLDNQQVTAEEIAALGRLLADFHGQAAIAATSDVYGSSEQVSRMVRAALAQLRAHDHRAEDAVRLAALAAWMEEQLARVQPWLRQRQQMGRIREGHGDMHARNVVRWRGRLVPFDCLEFDPQLRWIDVMNDVAFLTMDLLAHGRADLSFILLNAYLEATGDYQGMRMLSFYSMYRALVRAMVDALGVEQPARSPRREEFIRRLQQRLQIAERYTQPAAPLLVLMHGVSGSGKSWLSERLVPALQAIRIRSDVERKRLAVKAAHSVTVNGLYDAAFNSATYARVCECAEHCLEAGVTTLVDAALLTRERRETFYRLAVRLGLRHVVLSCEADTDVLRARLLQRAAAHSDPSDATVAVLERQLGNAHTLDEHELAQAIRIDTAQPDVIERTLAAVEAWRSTDQPTAIQSKS